MIDLAKLDTNKASEEGVWCDIENPATGEQTGIRIKVLGMDSKAYQDQTRKVQDRNLKKGFRGMKNLKSETLDNNRIELICVCTVEWENVQYNGETLKCDMENKKWLYKEYRWIFDQVDEFIGDRGNFWGVREVIRDLVEKILDMDLPDENENTKRDQLMQILKSSEEGSDFYESALAQLEAVPEIPFYLEHIWEWFWQLRKKVPSGFSEPNPITWENILAWRNLLDIQIRPIEIEIINEMDSVYLKYISEKKGK